VVELIATYQRANCRSRVSVFQLQTLESVVAASFIISGSRES